MAASRFEQVARARAAASRSRTSPCGVRHASRPCRRGRGDRRHCARTSARSDKPKVTVLPANAPDARANPRVVGVGDEQIAGTRLLEDLRLGVGDRVGATQRSPGARRRRWSRRARRARRCRPACGFPRRDSCPARPPPRRACAAAPAARAAGRCGCSSSPCSETPCSSRDRNSAASSFVVVLPALPVIATTFAPDRRRTSRARVLQRPCRVADLGSRAAPALPLLPRQDRRRVTTAPAAPAASAAATNSCPSNRSPRIATNRSPGASVRESIDHRSIRASAVARHHPAAGDGGDLRGGQRDRIATPLRSPASRCGAAPAPRARPPRRRTAASGRRSPGTSRVPCRRSAPDRLAARRGSPSRSPRADRRSRARASASCPLARDAIGAGMTMPRRISSMIRSGSSLRGLSDVTITRSLNRAATAPISGRFVRSRSPPQPNTVTMRPVASGRAVSSRFFSASSVCA